MKRAARTASKALLWLLLLAPLPWLAVGVANNTLGPDPGEAIVHQLGQLALWLLLASLSMSPIRGITGSAEWIRYRRLLGLFCFFYACLHLAAFAVLIVGMDLSNLAREFSERNYIVAGLAAIACLLPLAITSTRGWQRRLGARWKKLHRLVYLAALLALLHIWWQVRSDYGEALVYSLLLGVLFLPRLKQALGKV